MMHFFNMNRRNNSQVIAATTVTTAAATILTLAIIFTLTTTSTAAAATTNNTSNDISSSVTELSPQPIYQGYSRTVSQTPINETHISATDSGNGTLILPETGLTVNITTNGSGIFSLMKGAGQGEVTIKTEEEGNDSSGGSEETATSRFYQVVQVNYATGEGKGLMIAITHTNSTGILAPLNGTITTGVVQFQPNGQSNITLWEWQSGIPLPTGNDTTATPASGLLELSAQPVWVEHAAITGMTPINETHSSITYSGNGTLTLPNTTQTINTTSSGSSLVSIATESGQGKMTIRTQDGMEETATVTIYEIDRHPDTTTGEGKGIVIVVFNTNTTSGMLAPLNGMILVGVNEFQTTTGEGLLTLWEWKS
jgi:hypothetical protein